MADPWPTIHDEREVLAKDLSSLTDEQWATPSLCAGWTVRDALGHMTATAKMTPPKFFLALAGAGFRFNEMTDREITRETAGTPADNLAEFRRYAQASTPHPPPHPPSLGRPSAGWVRPSSTAPTSGGHWA
jgi:uncharacterized protein (TIGR03083 family)